MEINFKKKEVCELIEKYYKDVEHVDANVTISASREPVGIYETMSCVTKVKVAKKKKVLGIETLVKENLTEDEVLGIFNELLKESEYTITSLSYNDGVSPQSVGYYMDEHTEYRAYFNGITLYVKQKNNKKALNKTLG